MNYVIYLLFSIILLVGVGSQIGIPKIALIPELFSVMIFALLVPMAARMRRLDIDMKYIILLFFTVLHVLIGVIINEVPLGTIVIGSRPYLKWIPIFLLPVVHYFSYSDITKILKFLLAMLLLQLPAILLQRLVLFRTSESGDPMTGTLGFGGSGAVSTLLISGLAFLMAYYISGRIKTRTMALLSICIFLPTTMNETKITMFLLPIAIIVPFLFSAERHITRQQVINIVGISVVLISGYLAIYNYYQALAKRPGFEEFFSSSEERNYVIGKGGLSAEGLLSETERPDIVGYSEEQIGKSNTARFEKIRLAFTTLSESPVRLWTGVGIGNATLSIADSLSGNFARQIGVVSGGTIVSLLLWETGIGGISLFVLFLLFILKDSVSLARKGDVDGIIATAWIAVTGMMFLLMPYMNVLFFNALIYLYAFFSGYIASQRFRTRYNLV